jgi:putative heme-binding domain-containing protein
MVHSRHLILIASVLIGPIGGGLVAAEPSFERIFDGESLKGWSGDPKLWSVQDGAITGVTTDEEPLPYNKFLIWNGEVENFHLRAKVRLFGDSNSGIQYRSVHLKDEGEYVVGGYQCDIHPKAENNGMLYHERGRGIVAIHGQKVIVDGAGDKWITGTTGPVQQITLDQWNTFEVIATGNKLVHRLNGKTCAEIIDHHRDGRLMKGILALQVHRGPAMRVQVKDIELKRLPAGGMLSPKDAPIPTDAEKVPGRTPRPRKTKKNAQNGVKAGVDQDAAKLQKPSAIAAGPAIGENTATPVDRITSAKGFKVELLYSVPAEDQGSWVNLCTDDRGRLLVSDQFGGLYRITPPPRDTPIRPQDVESVPAEIRAVNGMVWAFGALYVGVNDYEQEIPSGLYRIRDSDGDDRLDDVELLREIQARGDHGVHAIVPTPDGKSLFLVTGNNAKPAEISRHSPVRQVWGEDHLLPSMPDGRGHNQGVLAPGGIIYHVSPDGKVFEAVANGFRNVFDAAVNRDGELFTYDADMEYDFNTAWYRPTRICHVTSGAEFGWRNGAGKRMPFYADNLPATLDIGPGSPTGMTFGYGAKFPAKYQDALYALDWSWGKLYAVHLEPAGSTYTATKEEFLTGAPLPITDAIIHPGDGAMYFTIGGRKVQSGLYRVTYVGDESTELINATADSSSARDTRHALEAYHGGQDPAAIAAAWPHLADADRFIRFAARTAIEHQPTHRWADKALAESDPAKQAEALLALARVTGVCPQHRSETTPPVDTDMRGKLLAAVASIEVSKLGLSQQLTLLRTTQIILNRFGEPDDVTTQKLIARFDPLFPAQAYEMNWLLCETLAWLQAPTVAEKTMALIASAATQEEQMQYARSIRMLKTGWTPELHEAYFEWFLKAASYKGGSSFRKFIEFIRDDAVASLSESQRASMAELLAREPVVKSVLDNLGEIFSGRESTEWTLDELSAAARTGLKRRDFTNGRRMFAATGCFACHRFGDQGGMTGPDLTSAGRRYSPHDLLDQIINPSKVINDQFSTVNVLTDSGSVHTGVVVNLKGDTITLNTDLTDPSKRVSIDRKEIEQMMASKISGMPTGLVNRMTTDEILDLMAYLISGGNSEHDFFRK